MKTINRILFAVCLLLSASYAQATHLVQEFFVPLPEDQVQKALKSLYSGIGSQMNTVISIVVTADSTVIHYDHWEDGYEIDLENPLQLTTQIWGDGINSNGVPPGYVNDPNGLSRGSVIALRNTVDLPRNPSAVRYDGRDLFGASIAVVATRAEWATSPGTVLAGAAEMLALRDYGTDFEMPVGQNLSAIDNGMFEYAGMLLVAAQDGTNCTYTDISTSATSLPTLNKGSNYQINGGVKAGNSLSCDKPVQVHLITGDVGANYESRWFLIYPTSRWSSDYYSPVGTAADGDAAFIFVYNPNGSSITVNYETLTGAGSFTVAANSTSKFQMPVSSGGQFTSAGGEKFYAVATVGANPNANNVHDWGFLLVPKGALTTEAVAGWAPGNGNLPPTDNGSPLWVTVDRDTTVRVDYYGDGGSLTAANGQTYDVDVPVKRLQSVIIVAPNHDNTGTRLFTTDGTLISAAWGQNPAVAGPAAPYLDMGTAVLPFPVPSIEKSAVLMTSGCTGGINDANGIPAQNECLRYTLKINNAGLTTLDANLVVDNLASVSGLSYITGSSAINGVAIPDGGVFPLTSPGYLIADIPPGDSSTITYDVKITASSGSLTNSVFLNNPNIRGSYTVIVPPPTPATCTLSFTDSSYNSAVTTYSVGNTLYLKLSNADLNQNTAAVETIAVVVKNPVAGSKDTETVTLTETGANTSIFTGSLPSSPSAGQTNNDGTLFFQQGDTIQVSSSYPTCAAATASIAVPSETKTLYLNDDGASGDLTGSLSRTVTGTTKSTAVLGGSGTATIAVDTTSSNKQAGVNGTGNLTIAHTTGAGSNRLMLVGIAYEDDDTAGFNVTTVTYNGVALTKLGTTVASPTEAKTEVWYLVNPSSGTYDLIINFANSGTGDAIAAGVTTFSGVNQSTPLGTQATNTGDSGTASVSVSSAVGEMIFDSVAWDDARNITVGAGQTALWEQTQGTAGNGITGAASTEAGAASVTMSWTGASDTWAIVAVPIKPATTVGNTTATFTQTPTMASNLVIPAGTIITANAYYTVATGSMPASPSITATLKYGSTPIATSSSASASSGLLTFAFPAQAGAITVPAGQAIVLDITTAQSGVTFTVDYDSTTKVSKIDLPTTTVITVDSTAIYDAPYPGGSVVTTANNGQTLYSRTTVSDPFGAYDITSVGLSVDGPGATCDLTATLGNSEIVNITTTSKVYESVWNTGACEGAYTVTATAKEGSENTVTATGATQVNLSALDTGTPGIVQFTDNTGADKTSYVPTADQVCLKVTDLDQAGTGSVSITVTAADNNPAPQNLTLTEVGSSGVFTGCFGSAGNSSPFGDSDVLTATYTDPTDATDVSTDTALVTSGAVPALLLSKTRVAPADGVAVVGEPVQYDITVTNPGATALATIALTDTYSSTCYTFQSASLTPNTNAPGSLGWTNVGPIAAGSSVKLSVTLTAKAACDAATAVNSVSASGSATAGPATATATLNNPKVTVTKTRTSAATANVGDTVTFDIQVTNSGNTAISTLPVSDSYSTCLEFVSATPSETSAGGGTVLWSDLGVLATSASKTINTTFKVVGACTPAQNTAEVNFAVDANGDTSVPGSDSATVTTTAASISGQVVNDNGAGGGTAADGIKNGSETGIAGVTVKVYRDSDGDGDLTTGTVTLVAVQTTDASGHYQFLNLALNTGSERYVVVETDPANYQSTGDSDGANDNKITVNVAAIQDYPNQNFFDVRPAISGQVRSDVDNDGVLADAESGVAGVTVTLYTDVNNNGAYDSGTDTAVGSPATTNASGNYRFFGVAAGKYLVVETDPSVATSTNDKDGNAPVANGFNTIAITLLSGVSSNGNDFLDHLAVAAPDVYTTVEAPASVAAGDPVTTLLTFGNQGDAAAEGVTYAVTLPAGLTGLSCAGATCDYDPATGALTITGLPTVLIPGQTEQVVVHYTAPGSGPLVATSGIATTTAGETPTPNNTDTANTTVSSSVVDVAAWLNAPAEATTGSTVNVPVNFTNLGGSTATDVNYTLTLPAGLSDVTCTGSGISCSYAGTTVTITGLPDSLDPGQTVGLTLSYTAPATGPVEVTATVNATNDSNTVNDSSTGSTVINAAATAPDVISTVAPPATAVAGSTVTVPVTYANLGPDAATVTLYDLDLSDALTNTDGSIEIRNNGALCVYTAGTGEITGCNLPSVLNPGQSIDLTLTYTAPASGTVTVTSNITATGETNLANNPSTGTTTVSAASVPDVYTTVDVPATVPAGGTVNALLSFGNQGLATAGDVSYAVTLPPNLSGVSCTGATCTYDSDTGVLTLTGLPTSLSPGQSEVVQLSYIAPASGSITVQAQIATTTTGETPTNNNAASASTTVQVDPVADVTTWIDAPATANSDKPVNVIAGFTNSGTDDAAGVTYTLNLPAGATVSYNGTVCTYSGGAVTGCGLPTILIPGQVVDLVASYTAPATGLVTVTSTVAATNDSDLGNNSASDSTVISTATTADVATTVAVPPTAPAGSTVTVPITYTNLGPAPAAGVTYTLTLPAGLSDVTCSGSGVSCSYAGTTVTITGLPATLAPGQTLDLTLSYTAPTNGVVSVTSTVSTSTSDSNSGNNTANGSTAITAAPTVDVYALVNAPATAVASSTVNVALTFGNQGNSPATGVNYSALLPAGLSGVSCTTGATCTYDSASGLVTISGLSEPLTAGQTQTATLTYTAPATTGTVPVTARISATGDPSFGGNNSASDSTVITAAPSTFSVSGTVFNDLDGSGLLNSESGTDAGGVYALLVNGSGDVVASVAVSGTDGAFSFSGIANGDYTVRLSSVDASSGVAPAASLPVGWLNTGESINGTSTDASANGDLAITVASANLTALTLGVRQAVPDVYTTVEAPASVAAGDPVTTLLTFGNQGDATAEDVTYTVTLPTGLTGLSCTGATCSYDPATGLLTLTGLLTSLIPGQTEQVLVTYPAPGSGPLAVTAVIATTTAGETPTPNNTDTASTAVSSSVVDVAAWLNAPAEAVTGSTVTVPVNFTNLGGAPATGVTYSLTLPTGLSGVTCSGSGISCSYEDDGPGVVTITGLPDSLDPSQTVGLTLSYTAPASTSSPVTVTATVNATSDSNAGNNSASGSTVINATATAPDVISTVALPATAVAGSTVTVPVSYRNLGPNVATGILYDLDLSGALTNADSSIEIRNNGALCVYTAGTGAITGCNLPSVLNPGQSIDLTLTYTAPASGAVTVTSNITAAGETNLVNNPSTGSTTVSAASVPDVYTTVDVPATVPAGGTVNALLSFGNQGLAAADGVSYAVTLPPNLSGVSCTGATCTYDSATGVLTLTGLPTSLSPGQSEVVQLSYIAPASGSVTVQAQIATTTLGETPTSNNAAQASTTVTGSATADVTTWIDAPATANSGQTVNVLAGFTNLGAADATGVTYTLSLPAGATVSYNGTACTYSGGLVTGCGLPTILTPGQTVELVSSYTAPATGPVTVTSTVAATNDSDAGNNSAGASTAISAAITADVATTVAPPPTAPAGSTVTVPITYTNLGPAPAAGVTYTLTLPAGLSDVTCSGSGVSCSYAGTTVTITGLPDTLDPGQTLDLTLSYTAPATGPVEVISTVAATNDSDAGNNSASGSTAITTAPTVDVYALVEAPETAVASSIVNVALTFGNQGSGSASGVSYSALLPAGLSGVSCTTANVTCTYNSASGLVTITGTGLPSSLDSGATATATLIYTAPATTGAVPVTARISATGDPGFGGNNSASDSTVITAAPSTFSVSGTVFNDLDGSGLLNSESGTDAGGVYALLVNGSGDVVASVAVSGTDGAFSFSGIANGDYTVRLSTAAGTVGNAAPAASLPVGWLNTGESTNGTSTDGSANGDLAITVASANLNTLTLGIRQQADLVVNQNGPVQVTANGSVTYTIQVANAGPSAANNATFSDPAPANLTDMTWTCSNAVGGAVCPAASGTGAINQTLATFPAGGSVTYTVTGTAPATGTVINIATITPPSGLYDPNLANNSDTVTTGLGTPPTTADLAVIKYGPATVAASGTLTYTIVVSNAGFGAANNAVFTDDAVTAGLSSVTWTCGSVTGGAICPNASGSGAISETIATFPAGGSLTYTVTGAAPVNGIIANTATITAPNNVADPDLSNDSDSAVTTVGNLTDSADLALIKTGPATVTAGGTVSYTLIASNQGPAAADGASVVDAFPLVLSNVTWICSAAADGAVCPTLNPDPASGNLNATIPTFPVGSRITFTVTGTAPNAGAFINHAEVIPPTGTRDPDPSNNPGGPVITQIATVELSGVVFNDNGVGTGGNIANGVQDGTEPGVNPGALNVVIVNSSSNQVLAVAAVDNNGDWNASAPPGTGYSAFITTINPAVGSTLAPAATLPSDWQVTGENTGGSAITPANGILTGINASTSLNNLNFGVQATTPTMTVNLTVPAVGNPGATNVAGQVVCTNSGNTVLTSATCTVSTDTSGASVDVDTCIASSGSADSLPVGATLTCPVTVTMPGTLGGADTSATEVALTATASANEITTPSIDTKNVGVIDAVGDGSSTLTQSVSGNTNYPLLSNDTVGTSAATLGASPNITQTITGVTKDSSGIANPFTLDSTTGELVVPNTTAVGDYVVTYQICATPAPTPAACDTATKNLTVSAAPVSDLTSSIACVPDPATVNSSVTCTLTCTNSASATAAAETASCNFTGTLPPGATPSGCPATSASLAAGASLSSCTLAFTPTTLAPVPLTGTSSSTTDESNTNNNDSTKNLTVNGLLVQPPLATNDSATTHYGVPITLPILANDAGGTASNGNATALKPAMVDLDPATVGLQSIKVLDGIGKFEVNTTTGAVTFTPAVGFYGQASLSYTVQDDLDPVAQTSNPALITVTVAPPPAPNTPVPPVANDDWATTPLDIPVTLTALTNDAPGLDGSGSATTLNSATVDLDTATAGIQASKITADGIWTVDATGVVTFSPASGFTGPATLPYTVQDNLSPTAQTSNEATLTVIVTGGSAPVANPDAGSTKVNVSATLAVLGNDTPSSGEALNPSTVDLDTGVADIQTTKITAEGTWTANANGTVTFVPASDYNSTGQPFTGTATLPYAVSDTSSQTESSTITVIVTPVVVTAVNDSDTTAYNTAKTVTVATNDSAAPGAVLDPSTVVLDTDSVTPGIQPGKTLPATNVGTWTVNADGTVTLTPVAGFTGPATVTYQISDSLGNVDTATLTITVGVAILPVTESGSGVSGTASIPISNVAANDTINGAPATLGDSGNATVAQSGSWPSGISLNPATGAISITAAVAPGVYNVTYQLCDKASPPNCATMRDTITVTVNSPAPSSLDFTAQPLCLRDTPYVDYRVVPIGVAAPNGVTLTWFKADGTVAQTLSNQPLTGRLLWPGAAVDASGNPTAWPGWSFVNGQWVQISDGLRPTLRLVATVNPTAEKTLSYPSETSQCSANPPVNAGAVSGVVFNDLNGNGVQDAGEPGLNSVAVGLYDNAGNPVATTTTNASGAYQFLSVPVGPYTVRETDPAGFASTTINQVPVSVTAAVPAIANFGDRQSGAITGVAFNDLNGNGVQDAGETGISGVQIDLLDNQGQVVATTTTGASGQYAFQNVNSGTYTVRETDPSGYVSTTLNTVAVTVPANGAATASFGDRQIGAVSGVVFNDLNGNGVQNAGEPGISGVTVTLKDAQGATVKTAVTDSAGHYLFTGVVAGNYQVEETDPSGYASTTPNAVAATVPANGSASANFGDRQIGAVSGVAFNDLNGNGVQDAGETGVSGVQIDLLDNQGQVVATLATDASGQYAFQNVNSGTYTVRETDPSGYVSTTPNAVVVTVPANGAATANFGDRQIGTVSGVVFNDLNGNRVQDAGEPGIGGVTVTLQDAQGATVKTAVTDGAGQYLFTGIAAGNYTVAETDPSGFASTTPNAVAVTVPANGAASANFGDRQIGTVSGVVFNDLNGDGVQNAGEPGISGVTVTLKDAQGATVKTAITDGNGRYLFTDIAAGNYQVEETDPAGYVSTTPNTVAVTVPASGSASANFGDRQIGAVSGVVFNDLNGNGVQDAGEPGIGGVTVTLQDAQGATVKTTTTDGNGYYLFTGVAAGDYQVVETDPAGYVSTTPNVAAVTVPANGAATANFGDRQPGAPNVFDPPSGRKTVNAAGYPVLEWRMVWINNGNVVANRVRVVDPIPAGTIYQPNSLRCEARGASTVATCAFDQPNNRVVYEGDIAADPGALTEAGAQNEVVILFQTGFQPGVITAENIADAYWDEDGNGRVDDNADGGQNPIKTNDGQPALPSTDIPTLSEWSFLLLVLLLMGLARERFVRRRPSGFNA